VDPRRSYRADSLIRSRTIERATPVEGVARTDGRDAIRMRRILGDAYNDPRPELAAGVLDLHFDPAIEK
jgi:hypothetical protein